jgi:hypothetical protein
MSEKELIGALIASDEYLALKALAPNFNLFDLLDEALREPAWSRIFSSLLDSTLPHGLRDRCFREWLMLLEGVHNHRTRLPSCLRKLPPGSIIRTSCEYSTAAGRRMDILARVLNPQHRVICAIGIENKLESPEQRSQIADYQAALCEAFPNATRLIVYLTPDGREPMSADSLSKCCCISASYRTMVGMCRKVQPRAQPKVAALLDSLATEIESTVLGEVKMKADAKALIGKLWADPAHRQALRLIAECIPTPRKLWETGLIKRITDKAALFRMLLDDECITFWPGRSSSPQEIKLWCAGEIAEQAGRLGFHVCYMLHCRDQMPDLGSEFSLRLMAWCDSAGGRQRLKRLQLEPALPPSGVCRNWSSWENIWTGGSYILQDIDTLDLKGMAKVVLDGAGRTYPTLAKRIAKASKGRS